MNPEKIKAIIEAYTAARCISQTAAIAEISTATGISQSSIYNWLNGSRRPTRANAQILATYARQSQNNYKKDEKKSCNQSKVGV